MKRHWKHRLRMLDLRAFRFQGGRLIHIGLEPDEGIQALGRDFVSVRRQDRLYLVPYRSLCTACGTLRAKPHPSHPDSLRQVLVQWIDPNSTLWHYFISRRGKLLRGAIVAVTRKGVLIRRCGHLHLLRWGCPKRSAPRLF
ncbi:MAG: hypothetical protein GX162_13470 [Firmicutes bacterium]|nr:hypothetical protein [Bacillota bacterium]